jgi:hypothetical protein
MFRPTPDLREHVRAFAFLEIPPGRIARLLGCTLAELETHFGHELRHAREEIVSSAWARIGELAAQRDDLRVALDASRLLADNRSLMDLAWQTDDLDVAFEACRAMLDGDQR